MSDETSAAIARRVVDEMALNLRRSPWMNWDTQTRQAAIACVDAGRAAASSEPRTIPPLTDDDEAEMFRRFQSFGYKDNYRHYYALAASRLGATVAASGTMSEKQAEFLTSPDLDAIKREAAREALTKCANALTPKWGNDSAVFDIFVFRDREYPAPVPEPPHVMVNGWRVTWDGERYVAKNSKEARYELSAVELCVRISKLDNGDADVVRVLALREGRGDGHAES